MMFLRKSDNTPNTLANKVPFWPVFSIAFALFIGIQLGAIPWRYRKHFWQIQGGVIGIVIGYAIGRFSSDSED